MKCEDKTVKFTQVSLAFILIYDLHDFHPSQWSNVPMSGEERFKYPLPQENKIGQMPHRYRRANPHPMPCLPPSSTLIGVLRDRRSKPV